MTVVDWDDLLSKAGSTTFEALPSNTYSVEVAKAEAKNASSSGRLMFVVQFKVLDGPYANRIVFNNFVLVPESEGALGFFFRHMAALGLGKEFFAGKPTPDTVANALVGKKCRIDVGQKPYNGETRNEVNKILPPQGGQAPAPVAPAPPPPPAAKTAPPAPAPKEAETVSASTGAPPEIPF